LQGKLPPELMTDTNKPPGGGLFQIALPICALVALAGILDPKGMASVAGAILTTVFGALDWFFMTVVTALLILTLWLAFGRF